ncbi:carbohydrate porin [Muricauda sp. CAU 1633]|uniref:carbohydrate porin n=1 Tax=Allomuricauda sp. CAU 1633 TaxID=2816036 RepID=UPI001A8CE0C8|nr:carbohydrate porin [Muricauda sp. CAU 1633]MBO0323673.1 carbohydrate porin [Muricauda sp. CAU 1633]
MGIKKLLIPFAFCLCGFLYAQTESNSKYLTGNWNGTRDSLEANGIILNPRLTVFSHNFVAGTGSSDYAFNGKAQLDGKFNGKILGLSRWTLVTKFEYNFGNALDGSGNVLIPKNTAVTFPGFTTGERFDISSVYFIYGWKPGNQVLFGKINMVDLVAGTAYSGGSGLDAFWNLAFAAPVSGITPPYIFGAISNITGEKLKWTFMVYDPASVAGKTGLESPFSEGVTLSVSPSWKVNIGNSKGSHAVRLAYSTQDGTNLYNLGDINPPVDVPLSDKDNRFYVSYSFNHPLMTIDKKHSWGLFGQFAISDGNPNPIDFSFQLGVGGNSFIKNRTQDKWGVAVYEYSLSSIVDDSAEQLGIPLRDEIGIETFYQYWLNNWVSIGADVQIVKPILKNSDTAVFIGFRSSVKF